MSRKTVSNKLIDEAIKEVRKKLYNIMKTKGNKQFVSPHEALGVVTEEYHELVEAVRTGVRITSELEDVAVAAIFSIASRNTGWDW